MQKPISKLNSKNDLKFHTRYDIDLIDLSLNIKTNTIAVKPTNVYFQCTTTSMIQLKLQERLNIPNYVRHLIYYNKGFVNLFLNISINSLDVKTSSDNIKSTSHFCSNSTLKKDNKFRILLCI